MKRLDYPVAPAEGRRDHRRRSCVAILAPRGTSSRCIRPAVLLAAIVAAAPVASAQDTTAAAPPGGWIGLVTDTARLRAGAEQHTLAIRVAGVQISGPAETSGVLPGDILLAWNGRALDSYSYPAWLRAVAELDPGQQIVLRLMRDGVEREVTVVASEAPTDELALRLDMTGFDSLPSVFHAIEGLLSSRQGTLEIISRTPGDGIAGWDSTSLRITMDDSSTTVGYERFEASPGWRIRSGLVQGFSVRGETRGAPLDTLPQTSGVAGPDTLATGSQADSLVGVDPVAEQLDPLTRIARGGALPVATPFDPFGAMAPVVLGGAEVRTVSRELGRYFGVEQGVVILEVITLSPARRAGFRPGDVIVAVADNEVATLPQLRAYLSAARLPVQVAVVRRGERIELIYPVR